MASAAVDGGGQEVQSDISQSHVKLPRVVADESFTDYSAYMEETIAAVRGTHCSCNMGSMDLRFCPSSIPDISGTGLLSFDAALGRYVASDGRHFSVTMCTAEVKVEAGQQCVYVPDEEPIYLCQDASNLGRLRAERPFCNHQVVDGALVDTDTGKVFAEYPVDISAIVNKAWNGWSAECVFAYNEEGAVPLADSCEALTAAVLASVRAHHAGVTPAKETWLVPSLGADLQTWGNGIMEAVVAAKPADYHPGSENIVNDVLHPSLYPYIWEQPSTLGSRAHSNFRTAIPPAGSGHDYLEELQMAKFGFGSMDDADLPQEDLWGRPYEGSIYQWLPSDWVVSDDGKVSLAAGSHLNAPRVCTPLLPLLEAVYTAAVPLLDGLLKHMVQQKWKSSTVKGRTLQIVPKIVEFELQPGQTYSGVWHYEAMSHENIIGTVLYVLRRDEGLQGGQLAFKRAFFSGAAEEAGMRTPQNPFKAVRDHMQELVPLGQTELPEGTLLVFPNCHAHRVMPLTNTTDALLRRRIVVGFVVNPEVTIPSAATVANLSESVALPDALAHREALMAERRLHKQSMNQREVNLCEH